MGDELDRTLLLDRRDDSYAQYYGLILGISQSVILALLFSKVSDAVFRCEFGTLAKCDELPTLPAFPVVFHFGHSFLLIVGVYYSYYWYTMLYRHLIGVFDI